MVSFGEKAKIKKAGNLNYGGSYVITTVLSPLSMFSINQPILPQKISLYIQIPIIYVGLGYEFGPQRIKDLAIVCP